MANVLHRTIGGSYPYHKDYRTSVSEPHFPQTDWIWNPDLSAVAGFDSIYWDISGDSVTLANTGERNSRDAEIAAANTVARQESEKVRYDDEAVLKAIIKLTVDQLNVLRANHGLGDITYAQARTAIRDAIDGGI
jgi:hypothetical protein